MVCDQPAQDSMVNSTNESFEVITNNKRESLKRDEKGSNLEQDGQMLLSASHCSETEHPLAIAKAFFLSGKFKA